MGLILQDSWTEVILLVTTFLLVVASYFHNSYKYWSRKGVPTVPPRFPLGNNNIYFPKGIMVGTLSKQFYDYLRQRGHKFGGVYLVTQPNLVLVDPDIIKDVLGKNFQHFVDRGFYHNIKDDPISAHLFAIDAPKWKNLRVKLTPTFTSGKIKAMFQTVLECSNYMKEALEESLNEDIDIKEVLGRFSTDVIGSCAFGITCNSFKYPDAEFRTMGIKAFNFSFWKSVKAFVVINYPKAAAKLGVVIDDEEVQDFFHRIVEDTVKLRQENGIERNDFLQLLMELRDDVNFGLKEMAAQSFVFFIAGFDTSSTAMCFALYELARNPQLQEKLRREIVEVLARHDGKITYESLQDMKYLQQVLDESLRMYPPLTNLNRRCTKDYTLPGTDVVVEKDTPVLISTLGLHMDPKYFPNPEKFDPDRFSVERKKDILPFTYLPFGDGPRNCIGLRFGVMQSKIGILTVIKNFRLTVSPITKPVKLSPYVFLLSPHDKVFLMAEKL